MTSHMDTTQNAFSFRFVSAKGKLLYLQEAVVSSLEEDPGELNLNLMLSHGLELG